MAFPRPHHRSIRICRTASRSIGEQNAVLGWGWTANLAGLSSLARLSPSTRTSSTEPMETLAARWNSPAHFRPRMHVDDKFAILSTRSESG